MGLFEDIRDEIGADVQETEHILGPDETLPVQLVSGPVEALADVRDLLPTELDHDESDVELTNGQLVSLYGLESEFTWVQLLDDPDAGLWVHAFKYADADDYGVGSDLQTPAVELRA